MFRLRREADDIADRIRTERSGVEDTKDKLLDTYRSQNEDLKKANSALQKAQDSFNAEKQELQERIELQGKHSINDLIANLFRLYIYTYF